MTIEFFTVLAVSGERPFDVDLGRPLSRQEAQAALKAGQPLVAKLWLNCSGATVDLSQLEEILAPRLAAVGLK